MKSYYTTASNTAKLTIPQTMHQNSKTKYMHQNSKLLKQVTQASYPSHSIKIEKAIYYFVSQGFTFEE